MMKKITLLLYASILLATSCFAQRFTDRLDRGLVVSGSEEGIFISWRIFGEEYYGTKYNLYRDGELIAEQLSVSNFLDIDGLGNNRYAVAAVINGHVGEKCKEVSAWPHQYKRIKMGPILSRKGNDVSSHYVLNDAAAGDLDGDGELELLIKRVNRTDATGNETEGWWPASNDSMYSVIQAYKMDGTLLWTIDAGPNQISHGDCVEMNCQCFDWDMDGKAEVLMRVTEGTIIYHPDGTTTEIGSLEQGLKDRIMAGHSGDWDYTSTGREWLLYAEGATCKPYGELIEYPLKRVEDDERKYLANGSFDVWGSLNAAWHHDKNSAHRANKFFFGAPYLDGVAPSIFLARGIYTRIKMCALDVDPHTHQLTTRWKWEDNNGWDSPWFGQGYHNYAIADVDLDGRDEIVYGSMVIDDNGKGLHTTGLGHGDSQHCTDLNPYRKGLEQFACNEDKPNNNYRNATTGEIYHRSAPGADDGRCMAGNFSDSFLGAQAFSSHDDIFSCVTNHHIGGMTKDGLSTVFRIYWDGDLCSETLQTGSGVFKYGSTDPIYDYNGKASEISGCNGSKDTPCFQGDLLGDWREEIVVPGPNHDELRIYTTTTPTPHAIYTLWHDHQYRNAMVWQPNGYNQPPHLSYFLGQLEGYTTAPPPVTTTGREIVNNITAAVNGKHALVYNTSCEEAKIVTIHPEAHPSILTVNAFSHTEGHNDNSSISTAFSTIEMQGCLQGNTTLVRQGEGSVFFDQDLLHSGKTVLWGGTTRINGGLPNSHLEMKRFSELCMKGSAGKNIVMEYGAVLHAPEGDSIATDTLEMNFGAALKLDLYSNQPDKGSKIKVKGVLNLRHTTRFDAPELHAPIIRIVPHMESGEKHLAGGTYTLVEADSINGDIGQLIIQGVEGNNYRLSYNDKKLVLTVSSMRKAGTVYWTGTENSDWDLDKTANWNLEGTPSTFVSGDYAIFDNAANNLTVNIKEDIITSGIEVQSGKDYIINGILRGETVLKKKGTGILTLTGENTYSGGTIIENGTIKTSSLVCIEKKTGNLGTGNITIRNGATLLNTKEIRHTLPITMGEGGGTINTTADFYQDDLLEGGKSYLKKDGEKGLFLTSTQNLKGIILENGTLGIRTEAVNLGDTIWVHNKATFQDWDTGNTYSLCQYRFHIDKGATLTWTGIDNRCEYRTELLGEGTLILNSPTFRTSWTGDWSQFEGTVKMADGAGGWALCNAYGLPKATLDLNGNENVTNNGQRFEIGIVKGEGKLHGVWNAGLKDAGSQNTWVLGTLNKNFTLDAKISGNSMLEKTGTGKMNVTSACDHSGGTQIKSGELCINRNNTSVAALGTGDIYVTKGAMLSGKGVVGGNVIISSGATLRPGISPTSILGALYLKGKDITINRGATLLFCAKTASLYTRIKDVGTLQIKGTLVVNVTDDASFDIGDEITLWDAEELVLGKDVTYQLATPGEGLAWDTSKITKGILTIISDATSITAPRLSESGHTFYDLSGKKVHEPFRGITISKKKKILKTF